ncbi:MAG: nucleotidyl transferase AbiEii/AbiGii toxin family protein, partial [Actinophytocola sp.]|nr:nucleotidyl transferase AbiEii/AbiGii toxin family protein [Actinophytocola sp.]
RLAASHGIEIPPYVAAVTAVTQLWLTMLPRE